MKTTLKIPEKCKVGFQKRDDTYTKKLGYIIMFDGKIWRKEPSWESWRTKFISEKDYQIEKLKAYNERVANVKNNYNHYKDKEGYYGEEMRRFDSLKAYLSHLKLDSIDNYNYQSHGASSDESIKPIEFDNIPIEGFVLNKKAGGYGSGWNHRQSVCRIYDPRGWEFEITIQNLIYILENTSSIKGKGLEGEFVYSWDGKDLVLLPANTPDYEELKKFNEVLKLKLTKKELVIGGIYLCTDNVERTYMGSFELYNWYGTCDAKKHNWFADCTNEKIRFDTYQMTHIKKYIGINDDYSFLMEKLQKQDYFKKPNYEEVTLEYLKEKCEVKYGNHEYIRYLIHTTDFKIYSDVTITSYKYGKKSENGEYGNYEIHIGKVTEIFKTLNELLNKYPLWKKIEK